MKLHRIFFAVVCASLFSSLLPLNASAKKMVKTGIEILKEQHFKPLEGLRVGLITNPTGVDKNLRSTIDVLNDAPNVKLVALYGPEHGVRGNLHAGVAANSSIDAITGLPIRSLFGKTRKPTPEMLNDIDILVYDIQDIGCRSYTYISTMGLAMQAAAECGKRFMVLDRPNPLGGNKVEGCLTEDGCFSFVSQFKIPYIYGLTCGELATLLNGERMLSNDKPCQLTVIKMKGWKRNMRYEDTGLQWIPASPHIPQTESALSYPASGLVGEFNYLNIGVGYTLPFQMFAAPWIEADKLTDRLNALHMPGVQFRPIFVKPFYATMKDEQIEGVQFYFTDYEAANVTDIQFLVAQEIAKLYPDKAFFLQADKKRYNMFDICCGSKQIRERFSQRHSWSDVKDYWYKDVAAWRSLIKKYILYK